jgi:hypothetical protein
MDYEASTLLHLIWLNKLVFNHVIFSMYFFAIDLDWISSLTFPLSIPETSMSYMANNLSLGLITFPFSASNMMSPGCFLYPCNDV